MHIHTHAAVLRGTLPFPSKVFLPSFLCVCACVGLCDSTEEAEQKPPEEDEQVRDTWATCHAKLIQLLKHLFLCRLLAANFMCIYM